MNKIYQSVVLDTAENIIENLTESGFFNDYELPSTSFAKELLCEKLTEKFIEVGSEIEGEVFSEKEFEEILKQIIVGTLLNELKNKGYINSYEDENTEETFFLTEDGKEMLKNLKSTDDEIKE